MRIVDINLFDAIKIVHEYSDVNSETIACRRNAALFDFSFMSSMRISGADSLNILSRVVKRDFENMKTGDIRYALSYNQSGFVRSDITLWKQSANEYLLMSGLPDDVNDLLDIEDSQLDYYIEDLSKKINIFSIQGPNSLHKLSHFLNGEILKRLSYFNFMKIDVLGTQCLIGRLGYTGELGFELIVPSKQSSLLWKHLSSQITPCGLIAINQLRIEAGFVFYGNEFRLPVTEKDLGLEQFSNNNAKKQDLRLICFEGSTNQNLDLWAPTGNLILPEINQIIVTSACRQPGTSKCIGLGFVKIFDEISCTQSYVDPSYSFWDIKEVPRPFYDTLKALPRTKLY